MKIVVTIPTYNEAENIESLIHKLFSLPINTLVVLVIDDNSPDGTAYKVSVLQKKYTNLHLIHRPQKMGLGTAYVSGFTRALKLGADYIIEMDADGSHDPSMVPIMLTYAQQGFDVVIGSRKISGGKIFGWNIYRHIASWCAMTIARYALNLTTKDVTAGFRCYSHTVLTAINLATITSNGYAFQEEMIWRCEQLGFTIKEIPITFEDRKHGKSKLSWKEVIEFFSVLIKLKIQQHSWKK